MHFRGGGIVIGTGIVFRHRFDSQTLDILKLIQVKVEKSKNELLIQSWGSLRTQVKVKQVEKINICCSLHHRA